MGTLAGSHFLSGWAEKGFPMANNKTKKVDEKNREKQTDKKTEEKRNHITERKLEKKQDENEVREDERKEIEETGTLCLSDSRKNHKIELLTIIGEVEGHELLSASSKSTKYEHILPRLAQIEDDENVDGVLVLLNTCGGDVEAGLAIAEMIASLSKPTVSLVLGGSHSIGVPIAVSTSYSFIVESATMVIHPVRLTGMVIGTTSTYDYFQSIQNRITGFVCSHSHITKKSFDRLLMETKVLTKDVGSILVGEKAVDYGLIDAVGGIREALKKLHQLIDDNFEKK